MATRNSGTGASAGSVALVKVDTAATVADLANATDGLGALKTLIDAVQTDMDEIVQLSTHETAIFPTATNLTCTLTAHADANTWSAYTEIVDSAATTLSSVFAACDGHVTAMVTESANTDDTTYMVELSYGASHTVISEWRLVSGTRKVSSTGQSSARGAHIPLGETVYARVMCETAGSKTLAVHFRHFCHI